MRWLALLALTTIAGYAAYWLRERRRKMVFPAARADRLLSPARRYLQPLSATVAAFQLRGGDIALELGSGPGYFSDETARAVAPEGRLLCVDVQREMLVRLRGRLSAGARADLIVADAQRLPLRGGVVDAAFVIGVLGEVPDPRTALDELHRALRTGGSASFGEHFIDPDYVRWTVLREMCWGAGFAVAERRRQFLGYFARFVAR
jgi:ubiquinone/menaquinone biosynthesis C-methylase UbiE